MKNRFKLPSFKQLKAVASGTVKLAAKAADVGLFAGLPVVTAVVELASTIAEGLEMLEVKNSTGDNMSIDDTCAQVFSMMVAIVELIELLNASTVASDSDKVTIMSALKAMEATLEGVQAHLDDYAASTSTRTSGSKFAMGDIARLIELLGTDMPKLDRQLHLLSSAVTGQTYVEILKSKKMLENLSLGLYSTDSHIAELKESMATSEQVDEVISKMDSMTKMMKTKGARDIKEERASTLQIDECDVTWDEEKPFANGTFGDVYRVTYEYNICIAKKINLKSIPPNRLEATKSDIFKEIAVMGELRSTFTVQIFGSIMRRTESIIIMEYCEGGSLRAFLDNSESFLTRGDIVQALLEIACGMKYLHSHNVIHRDLKSPNVLIGKDGSFKIADFGQSKSASLATSATMAGSGGTGTAAWNAPEVHEDEEVTSKADVYAFAIIIWECLTKDYPWEGLTMMQIGRKVCDKELRPAVKDSMDPVLRELMEVCWATNPSTRPDFYEIVRRLEPLAEKGRTRVMSENPSGGGAEEALRRAEDQMEQERKAMQQQMRELEERAAAAEKKAVMGGGAKKRTPISQLGAAELWAKVKEEVDVSENTMSVDTFVTGAEGVFFDYENIKEAKLLVELIDTNSNSQVTKNEFMKFVKLWKSSKHGSDIADFLDSIARKREREREREREEEEEEEENSNLEKLRKQQREAEEKEKAAEEESRRAAANAELLRKQEAAKQIEAEERRAELKRLADVKEQQDSSDAEVLKKLAMALGKDLKWLQNGGGEDVAKWKGVEWDAKKERVVKIVWKTQELKGELLPIIGQLTSLQELYLANNSNLSGK